MKKFIFLFYLKNLIDRSVLGTVTKLMHTQNKVIQYNEYYPFGLQTASSWTRENTTGNNFLANGATELNTTSQLYDLEYRNYDPILGRMNGVDPMASKYASLTPYNYSFNDPVTFNDPNGADPYDHYSGGSGYYFSGGYYTYDDVAPNNMGEFHDAFGWRDSYSMGFLASAMGYGRMSSWQSSSFAGMDSKRRNDRVEIDWDLLGDGVYTFQFNDRGGLVYFSQLSVYSNSSEYGTSYFLQDRYGYNQYFASVGYGVQLQNGMQRPAPIDIWAKDRQKVFDGLVEHLWYWVIIVTKLIT